MKRLALISVLLLAVLVSCSVKEDRTTCPVWLTIELDNIGTNVGVLNWRLFRSGEAEFSDTISVERHRTEPYEYRIYPRGPVEISFWFGAGENALIQGRFIDTPYGFQSDSLYASHFGLMANHEEPHLQAELHKQFTTFSVIHDAPVNNERSGAFTIKASCGGFDLTDFKPHEGAGFYFNFKKTEGSNRYDVRLPRQKRDSEISIHYESGEGLVWDMDLRPLLNELAYDWEKEELDDLMFRLDGSTVFMWIEGWEEGKVWTELY